MCSRPPEPTTSTVSDDVSVMGKGLSERLHFLGNKKLGERRTRLTQLLVAVLTPMKYVGPASRVAKNSRVGLYTGRVSMLLFDRPRPCNQGICSVAIEIDDLRGISRKQQIVIDPSWHALLLDHEPE